MRFGRAQKVTLYLACWTAFGAVFMSAELDPLTMLLGTVGIFGSWWLDPGRVRLARLTPWLTAAAIMALLFALLTALTGEILLAGTRFLVHLLLIKLCSRRGARDVQQVLLLSMLLIAAGTAVNTGPSYALLFAGYVVFSTWALILFHLRRELEENFLVRGDGSDARPAQLERVLESRRIVGRGFFLGTGGASLAILLGAVLFFIAFPRIGFGLFFQKHRSGINVAGFSEKVELGGHGTIRDDDTVVMRVYVDDPRFRGEHGDSLHWRGIVFDEYQDGRWSRKETQQTQAGGLVFLDFGPKDGLGLRLEQDIYLEPLDSTVLFGASLPESFKVPVLGIGPNARSAERANGQMVRIDHEAGIRYHVVSHPDQPSRRLLAQAIDVDPRRFALDLQLPDKLPARIGELAREITKDAHGPLEKVLAIHSYLHDNFSYTLEQETNPSFEPLDYFLFERKKGHCEYFATAMAILLREVGVPTRNVNGFLGGEWNDYGGYIAVRSGDAHSWVEVWFEGVGWVTWDPTPAGAVGTEDGALASLHRFMDTLRMQYFKWVLEYDLSRQLSIFKGLSELFSGGGKLSTRRLGEWAKRNKWTFLGILGAIGGVILLRALLRRKKTARPDASPRTRDPVVQLYYRTADRLARAGFGRGGGTTPREHAQRLLATHAPGAEPFSALTEQYYDARFGEGADLTAATPLAEAVRLALKTRNKVSHT